MSRQVHLLGLMLAITGLLSSACQPTQPFYFFEDGDLSHYRGFATDIEFPDVETCGLAEVEGAMPPLTLGNSEAHEIWDVTLEEAVHYTLVNSRVMRQIGGQVQTPSENLLRNPDFAPTVYDPAIVESNARTGVEAALAAFDTQFTTSLFWERNDRPVNFNLGGLVAAQLQQDLGTFQTQLQKVSATGATFALRQNTNYDYNNNDASNLFPSVWTANVEAEFRQPLLQGAGVQFNRIAGPNNTPGFFFSNGVVLARINTDIALADFEANVRDLISDLETAYWELYFAYRNLDAVIAGRDSALESWRKAYALYVSGAQGGRAEEEAQAREQYFLFRGQVETALTTVYSTENRLRFIMGLAATDGRLIRPADEPTTAKVFFDWFEVHAESLARNVDLRRQKWRIKQREMELIGSRNFLLPRLDAVGRYRWLGLGDDLIDSGGNNQPFDNAIETLTGGDFQEWQLGLQASVPLGFRRELAGVRNAQLQLARDRAILQDQELELSHQLSDAIRQLDLSYTLTQTNFNRRAAAQRQVEAVKAAHEVGQVTLDLLLDAQRRLADAESQMFRAAVDYNLAIMRVHFLKNSLLEYDGVNLAEGPWPGKAYFDATRLARQRDSAKYMNFGFTRPRVMSQGPVQQRIGTGNMHGEYPAYNEQSVPTEAPPEEILPPQPQASTMPARPAFADQQVQLPSRSQRPNRGTRTGNDGFDWGSLGLRPTVAGPTRPAGSDLRQVTHERPSRTSTNEVVTPETHSATDQSAPGRPGQQY